MTKDEAMQEAYDMLSRIVKGGDSDTMAGLALVSAKRSKDYEWFAEQIEDFIDMFNEWDKVLRDK